MGISRLVSPRRKLKALGFGTQGGDESPKRRDGGPAKFRNIQVPNKLPVAIGNAPNRGGGARRIL